MFRCQAEVSQKSAKRQVFHFRAIHNAFFKTSRHPMMVMPGERMIHMKRPCMLFLLLLLPSMVGAGPEYPAMQLPDIKVIPITDSAADRQYELYVKLPESYASDPDRAFPVIYFTDALWHMEILSGATEYLMKEAILVGLSWQKDMDEQLYEEVGAHVSRFRDYTVRASKDPEVQAKYQLGQAQQHLAFLRNDVMKSIEHNYRILADQRAYFGYSAGGLFGAYTLMVQPDTFDHYVLGSPSVDGDINLLSKVRAGSVPATEFSKANVFISYGSAEKELAVHIHQFIDLLKSGGVHKPAIELRIIEGDHQTAFPMTGISAVTWLSKLLNQGEKP